MPFTSLGLAPALAEAVAAIGYQTPTPIQAAAVPAALAGRDVLGAARTGSGKTAAFALPMLHALLARQGTRRGLHGLVLVPTRELAAQVGEAIRELVQHLPSTIKVSIVFGGVSINPQMMALRGGTDIVVATPGRLLDLVEHNALALEHTATLVLDEADKLLDMGFADEITRILALLPPRRQNLFFSATFPPAVQALAAALLADPVKVEVQADGSDARAIDIAQLPVVVNFDLPRSPADYTHRIGRTGRAGASGTAVSFVSADTEQHFRLIEKRHGLRLAREIVAGYEPVETVAPPASTATDTVNGGIKGKRKSKKDKLREAAAAGAAVERSEERRVGKE